MDERVDQINENTAPERDAREVVLTYTTAPRSVVERYVQPTLLPGRRTPPTEAEEDEELETPHHRRIRRILLSALALLLVVSLLLSILYGSGLLAPREKRSTSSEMERHENEQSVAVSHAKTRIARYPNGDGTRLRYYPADGEVLSIQQVYERVNPCTVTVATEISPTSMTIGTGVASIATMIAAIANMMK